MKFSSAASEGYNTKVFWWYELCLTRVHYFYTKGFNVELIKFSSAMAIFMITWKYKRYSYLVAFSFGARSLCTIWNKTYWCSHSHTVWSTTFIWARDEKDKFSLRAMLSRFLFQRAVVCQRIVTRRVTYFQTDPVRGYYSKVGLHYKFSLLSLAGLQLSTRFLCCCLTFVCIEDLY